MPHDDAAGSNLARLNSRGRTCERTVLLGLGGLALLGGVLGASAPPSAEAHQSSVQQGIDVCRVLGTTALVIVLVLGPGVVWRARFPKGPSALAFLPLPGLALLAVVGAFAWGLAGQIGARMVCGVVLLPMLGWLLIEALRPQQAELLSAEERRALLVVGAALGIAVARALWSLGPAGELYGDSISRTLEVGDRSDSRIPFHVVQLVAHGTAPFSRLGGSYFFPYTFSDRGPLAGVASAPVVLVAGGRPPERPPDAQWAPFDPQGFMAYRLAMMTFACTAFLSLWTLTRRLAGVRAARLAVLLGATTPFLVHEVWFTWPKLLSASFVLLAALSMVEDRPLRAGLLVGIGYLVHPLALLSIPALVLLALWPLVGARLRIPRLGYAAGVLGGAATALVAWRLVNGSHYTQGDFLRYFTTAGRKVPFGSPVTLTAWASDRLESLGNTVVPLRLAFFSVRDPSVNVVAPTCTPPCDLSPPVVHFFFQYWTTLPFGLGIVVFALFLASIVRAGRTWKWPVFVAVVVPLVSFAIYWGGASTGMLREGLHTWILTLLIVVAVEQGHAGFPWLRSPVTRTLLTLRSLELLLVALVPTIVTRHRLYAAPFALSDLVALVAMFLLCGWLAWMVWREGAPRARASAEQGADPTP